MFRLTREVRFAVNAIPDEQLSHPPSNSYGGYPSLTGAGQYFTLRVTVAGELERQTSYLLNIKQIDEAVRRRAIPRFYSLARRDRFESGAGALRTVFDLLRNDFDGVTLEAMKLYLTPFMSLEIQASEHPMVRLSQKFEFSASHRLHNPALSEDENHRRFGKCNNPHGHGHNYELQVTLLGKPGDDGQLFIGMPDFERIVSSTVIERFDHKNLNLEVEQFKKLIPSVENIAQVIYRLLKPEFENENGQLASVTVWETPKTWCEYSE